MKAVVLNIAKSKLSPNYDSVALRIAYLLGIKAMPSGGDYDAVHYDVDEKNIPLEMQIRLIGDFRKQDMEEDEWSAEEALFLLKEFKKMKHPAPEVIKRRRILEKHVNDLFMDYIEETRVKLERTGLLQLQPLFNEEVSGGYVIKDESVAEERKGFIAMSKLLMRTHENAEGEFLFLPSAFFTFCDDDGWELTLSSDPEKAKETNGYLQHLFTLPNVNLLSATELQSTRSRLKAGADILIPKLKAWMEAVDAGKPLSETVALFNKDVLPSTPELLHAMAGDDVLNHASRMMKDLVSADVFAGELSAEGIWSFYRWADVVPDNTWEILEKAIEEEGYDEKRFPVMVLLTKNELLTEEKTAEPKTEEEYKIMPVKKSIVID